MSTESFYDSLPIHENMDELLAAEHLQPLPHDWHILMTDVRGSTRAVTNGEYREVILLGASTIISVVNAVGKVDIPFAFGGDGAVLCVPQSLQIDAFDALLGLRNLARQRFNLDLRVGSIPMHEIAKSGHRVLIGRYKLSEHNELAVFGGGGIDYADSLLKRQKSTNGITLEKKEIPPPSLNGLECRWQPVKSNQGLFLCLIVRALSEIEQDRDQVFQKLLCHMREIYTVVQLERPVEPSNLKLSLQKRWLLSETRARTKRKSLWIYWCYLLFLRGQILLGMFLMRFNIRINNFDWGSYRAALAKNTDYRSFADVYAHVLAGSEEQHRKLERYLEKQYRKGILAYGIHQSEYALLTCHITQYSGKHLHFLDGGEGGLTFAAAAMKKKYVNLSRGNIIE